MSTEITQGIKVSVDTSYEGRYTNKEGVWYVFSYDIEIENLTLQSIRIMNRQWNIFDSRLGMHVVEGEGIVGEQPEILPGKSHRYQSSCHLAGTFGYMEGVYGAIREADGKKLSIQVPRFELWTPWMKN